MHGEYYRNFAYIVCTSTNLRLTDFGADSFGAKPILRRNHSSADPRKANPLWTERERRTASMKIMGRSLTVILARGDNLIARSLAVINVTGALRRTYVRAHVHSYVHIYMYRARNNGFRQNKSRQ